MKNLWKLNGHEITDLLNNKEVSATEICNDLIEHIEKISIGDLVTTSGKGGIFPPFQLIGQVVGKNSDEIEISIFENIATLSHVKLLNYRLIKQN